jgi:PAS domain S-box-containing protein
MARHLHEGSVLNDRVTPENRQSLRGFPLAGKLVLGFALLCAILTAIGGVFSFSLRSIEKLNGAERSSALGEIAILHRVGKNVGLRQVEVFRHLATPNLEEKKRHEQIIARLVATNTKGLADYEQTVDNEGEKRLLAEVLQAREAYADRTGQLLALSRAQRNAEATAFVLTTQVPTYDRYQSSLDGLLRFEEAEGRGFAAATTERIQQTRILGDILIGLAIVVALGTSAAVLKMVRRLRQDKKSLRTEVIERESAEQALRCAAETLSAQEKQYRLLFEDNPTPMWVFDVQSLKILAVNHAAISSYGYSREEFLARTLRDIRPAEDVAALLKSVSSASAPSMFGGEWRHLKKDGSIITAAVYSSPVVFDNNKARMVLAVDRTQQAAAEGKVRASEANLALAQQVAGVGSWEYPFTADGQVDEGKLLWSQEAYRQFGLSPDEFQISNDAFFKAVHPDDRTFVSARFEVFKAGSEPFDSDYRIIRPDGTERIIHAVAKKIFDPRSGKPLKIVGTLLDITERRVVEKQLREADEKYRSIFDNAFEGIFQSTPEGFFISTNPAFARMLGFASPEELIRERNDITRQSYAEPAKRQEFKRLLEENGVVNDFEFEAKRKDGSTIWMSENVRMVRDPAGKALYYEGTAQDITEHKRSEEVAAESERRFRFLNDLGNATRALSQPKEIMAIVARLLGTHLRVSRCAYAEVEADGDRFTVTGDYTDGCAGIVGEYHLSDFGSHAHSELAAGRTLVLRDVDADLTSADGADAFNAIASKAIIVCPLIKNGELRAMMAVHHVAPREWTSAEIALVQEVVERFWSIMERARAELVLRESEEHLRLVIAASNDGIWENDFLTGELKWSDRMYEMLGLDRRSFVPTVDSLTALLHPNERVSFQDAVREQMAQGGRYEAHMRIVRHDGSYGNFLGRARAVIDAAGRPIRIVGSLADLTSLLQAEQKLVEQGNLLNLAQDAIMVRDMDDRIEFWNHGAELLYGWTAEEARGRLSGDFLHYEEPVKILAERTLLETGVWSGECHHLTKQGDSVVVRSRWTLVRDEHGRPKSKLIIATDMTEQKKIEEQFLRAQRLESIGTLASGVAHDLNNILLPIMMAAPILREEIDPAERDKFLDIVETSAQRGANIIKQVLTFARGADGDHVLLQPIYLLEEIATIAGQTFPKSIALRTSYDEHIRSLEADPTQLHQVLLNLCINARDAMPNGGKLCLGAENFDVDEHYASMTPGATAGPHVILDVTDTGSGIPKDVIDKIFNPFFTTKSIGEGTGLGLSTVAGIVKSHGGFIKLDSKPGHTSFKIFLPAKETLDTASALPAESIVPRGDGQTILVVDDEPSIREVAQLILESHGYTVLVAEDGPEALALFAQQAAKVAAVVTDLAMPLMNGLMLVRALRRIEPRLKIIISTGRNDDSQERQMAILKVDGYLMKPFTTRNLLLKLNHVLHPGLQDAA